MKKPRTNKQLIVSALRSAWMKSLERREALKAAKHPNRTGWFICTYCKQEREKISVDHRPAIGSLDEDLSNLTEYGRKMFFGKQFAACRDCHLQKTKEDRRLIREIKKQKNK